MTFVGNFLSKIPKIYYLVTWHFKHFFAVLLFNSYNNLNFRAKNYFFASFFLIHEFWQKSRMRLFYWFSDIVSLTAFCQISDFKPFMQFYFQVLVGPTDAFRQYFLFLWCMRQLWFYFLHCVSWSIFRKNFGKFLIIIKVRDLRRCGFEKLPI